MILKISRKYITIIILSLLLIGCDENPRCVEADDFGFSKASSSPQGFDTRVPPSWPSWYEYSKWEYVGLVLDGEPLEFTFRGAWTSWNLGEGVVDLCASPTHLERTSSPMTGTKFKQINPIKPCWFVYGEGVYIGFSIDGGVNIKAYHLGAPGRYSGGIYQLSADEVSAIRVGLGASTYGDIRIYQKIEDIYYSDNAAGKVKDDTEALARARNHNLQNGDIEKSSETPEIMFRRGAVDPNPYILEGIANVIIDPAREAMQSMYTTFIASPIYHNLLRVTLAIYITFFAIGFMTGFIAAEVKRDIPIMILKIGLIYTLVSPGSWHFFNDYVVKIFWDGSQTLAHMALDAFNQASDPNNSNTIIATHAYTDRTILAPVDDVLRLFGSKEINIKIAALLFKDALGFVAIVAIYFSFMVFFFAALQLTILFVFVFITLMLLFTLAPIFLVFLLFKETRGYFEAWLQGLIGAAVQPMMLFLFIGIFLDIIKYYFYKILYFRACWGTVLDLIVYPVKFWKAEGGKVLKSTQAVHSQGDLDAGLIAGTSVWEVVETVPLNFFDILSFALTAYLMKYVIDMIPAIAQKIAGGLNISNLAQYGIGMVKFADTLAGNIAKGTGKGLFKTTVGRGIAAVANWADQNATGVVGRNTIGRIAKHIPGTKARIFRKAEKELKKDLKAKGYSKKEIKKAIRSGKLKDKLSLIMARKEAKKFRFSQPLKSLGKLKKKIMNNLSYQLKKSAQEVGGKRLTKEQKRNLKNKDVDPQAKEIQADEKHQNRVDDLIERKMGKLDFDKALDKVEVDDKHDHRRDASKQVNDDLQKNLEKKGYTPDDAGDLIKANQEKVQQMLDKDFAFEEQYEDHNVQDNDDDKKD
jgi:type IV secretory pathway VirB6-like protein